MKEEDCELINKCFIFTIFLFSKEKPYLVNLYLYKLHYANLNQKNFLNKNNPLIS